MWRKQRLGEQGAVEQLTTERQGPAAATLQLQDLNAFLGHMLKRTP